jgi:hypothetical protein
MVGGIGVAVNRVSVVAPSAGDGDGLDPFGLR